MIQGLSAHPISLLLPGSSAMEANVGPVVRRLYLSVYNWAVFFGRSVVLAVVFNF